MTKRGVWRGAKIILSLWGLLGIILYYTQDHFIWHPVRLAAPNAFEGQPHAELNIAYDRETTLNLVDCKAVDRPPDSLAKGIVLFFHDNRHDLDGYSRMAPAFTRNGYEFLVWDYPGFGKSTGEMGEQKLYDYALAIYKLARSRWAPSAIILYGQGIGCGIAAQLADIRDCRRLVLESPFYSLTSVMYHYLPVYPWGRMLHYHFPVYSHLPAVTAPVNVFATTSGSPYPYGNALRLKPLLKPGAFITLEGQTDPQTNPLFREKLDSLLAR